MVNLNGSNFLIGKNRKNFFFFIIFVVFSFLGCSKSENQSLPEETPEQVVKKFYSYLKQGGKRTLGEAEKMVYMKGAGASSRSFRRWTEHYHRETEIDILGNRILDRSTEDGSTIAAVQLSVKVPSTFGGFHKTESVMHLVLDGKNNVWQIDFFAETVDEENFKRQTGG